MLLMQAEGGGEVVWIPGAMLSKAAAPQMGPAFKQAGHMLCKQALEGGALLRMHGAGLRSGAI